VFSIFVKSPIEHWTEKDGFYLKHFDILYPLKSIQIDESMFKVNIQLDNTKKNCLYELVYKSDHE